MLDSINGRKRTHMCGEVTSEQKGVTVGGFVQKIRDLGNLIFIDLRDQTGIVQLSLNDSTDKEVFEKARTVRSEYVLMVTGDAVKREKPNTEMKTGEIEIFPTELLILAKSQTPPFEVSASKKVNDETRLKYRYLDLRNPESQKNIIMRHRVAAAARDYFYKNGFLEIETPMLMKSTPEGARDYLVPSRIHEGKFYALPQSPQIYKQLLMVSGFDRYVQLARCFRDEDLRADRQPEFTQIDLEMSFADTDTLIETGEGMLKAIFKETLGVDVELPMRRITFKEAMEKYGSDKPDLRFGMEITDISDAVKDIDFVVFKSALDDGGSVRCIVLKGGAEVYTRKEIDKLTEHAKGIGAKGLAYIRWVDEPNCSFKKFLKDGELESILSAGGCEKGDVMLIVADKDKVVLPTLGALRLVAGKKLGLIKEGYEFAVITEMPFFEYDDETGKWLAMHHPFTMPMRECLDILETDPANVRAEAFDFVLNGTELCSGSMRITDFELQQKMFKALGLTDEEIEAKFGFLVDAYRYGAPPHGGMGFGLDRLAMIICGADSLRDVVAFPKVQNASEIMSACPAEVDPAQLDELHIKTVKTPDKEQ